MTFHFGKKDCKTIGDCVSKMKICQEKYSCSVILIQINTKKIFDKYSAVEKYGGYCLLIKGTMLAFQ